MDVGEDVGEEQEEKELDGGEEVKGRMRKVEE